MIQRLYTYKDIIRGSAEYITRIYTFVIIPAPFAKVTLPHHAVDVRTHKVCIILLQREEYGAVKYYVRSILWVPARYLLGKSKYSMVTVKLSYVISVMSTAISRNVKLYFK